MRLVSIQRVFNAVFQGLVGIVDDFLNDNYAGKCFELDFRSQSRKICKPTITYQKGA